MIRNSEERVKQKNIRPVPSSEAALRRMQAAKPRDTAPELALRAALHQKGLRYRVDTRPIPGFNRRADIVFRPIRLAIFIDGCFWHGCPLHGSQAKANAEFWKSKIERNRERDKDTTKQLEDAGWMVIRVWEHEDPGRVSEKIYNVVRERQREATV